MFAVIGLGNPGDRYTNTRHNVGFWVAQILADKARVGKWQKKGDALFSRAEISGQDTLILMPQAFMNLSGQASRPLLTFYKIQPQDVIVVHDELDLIPGSLKIKRGGGDAGHKGVKDLTKHLGTSEFVRVRLGVGHPRSLAGEDGSELRKTHRSDQDVSSWVLSAPPAADRQLIEGAAMSAAEAVGVIVSTGLAEAQQKFNRNGP